MLCDVKSRDISQLKGFNLFTGVYHSVGISLVISSLIIEQVNPGCSTKVERITFQVQNKFQLSLN